MCELFAMSAGQHYTAQDYLPLFADKSRDNISGWGIGFFREGPGATSKNPAKASTPATRCTTAFSAWPG